MAGFLEGNAGRFIRSRFNNLSRYGLKYDDLLVKNSQAIGFIESQLGSGGSYAGDNLMKATLALSDTTSSLKTKAIAFFQLDYVSKRERLRDVASSGEIEFILETITDDVIVYDEDNRFCYVNDLIGEMSYLGDNRKNRLEYQDRISQSYKKAFTKIYSRWGFDQGISAWQYFYQWLIEGHLAFEIIYDDIVNPKEIIGFKELDPASLYPEVTQSEEGKLILQWTQRDPLTKQNRQLSDSQIIYISYSNHMRTKRVSFAERLVRSFNMLRIIEHSKVIWHTMHAPIRLVTTVPIGTKSMQKGQEDVREFTNTLKEDIYFDGESGELKVDGKPNILFYKNYVVPVNDQQQQVKIEPLEYAGPNLSGSELLKYFTEKLKQDSKIPASRFSEGGGIFTLTSEGISREEIRYNKFIHRLRAAYKELITKPLYLQMCLDVKELRNDDKFKNAVGVVWYDDNVFEEIKNQDLLNKRIAAINALKAITNDYGKPYFSSDFLVTEYLKMSDQLLRKNKDYLAKSGGSSGEAQDAEVVLPEPAGGMAPAENLVDQGSPGKETASEMGETGDL